MMSFIYSLYANVMWSLAYFKPEYMSLGKPHPIWLTCGSNPFEVNKAVIQARMLSGRYRTERLARYWTKNKQGLCLLPACQSIGKQETLQHILADCDSLMLTRQKLLSFTQNYIQRLPYHICVLVERYCSPHHYLFPQFIVDCSTLPAVIAAVQENGDGVLYHLFRVTRTWCYALHKERLRQLGRWNMLQ